MHSLTTTFCAILTGLRGAIAHIAARDRAHFLDFLLFPNFLWARISRTAQLFDLFERLVAEWRNGTLPGPAACHPSPGPAPGSSPNCACPPAPVRSNTSSPPPPISPNSSPPKPGACSTPSAQARHHPAPTRGEAHITLHPNTRSRSQPPKPLLKIFVPLTAPPSHAQIVPI